MYRRVMKRFLPELFTSEEMISYLQENIDLLEKWQILEMFCGAPVPLTRKLEILKELFQYEDLEQEIREGFRSEEFIREYAFQTYISELESALGELELKSGELFILYTQIGHEDDTEETIPFLSLEKVYHHLNGKASEFYEENTWHKLEKWVTNENGELVLTICYQIIGGQITNYYRCNVHDSFGYFEVSADLNLPIPFQCGDIIEVDGWPFYEKARALITDIGDNHDCCCVQVLYVTEERKIEISALKHGGIWRNCWPRQSPLYRVKRYSGELHGEEVLRVVQKFIRDNRDFWMENGVYWDLWLENVAIEDITEAYLESLKETEE